MSGTDPTCGEHISDICTLWSDIREAHVGAPGCASAAQDRLLRRYRPAVHRYLRACLGNPDHADEVWSEFSLRFVRGDFRNANPEKGRFRDLLKTAIYHLVIDFHKKRKRGMPNLPANSPEPEDHAPQTPSTSDEEFLKAWRNELLNRCWEALAEEEGRTGRPLHTVLRCRASNLDLRSPELAKVLTGQLGRPITADWVRKWVALARSSFADTLLREVAGSLRQPTVEAVEEELIDLELYQHCKDAVDRWRETLSGGCVTQRS